MAFDAAGRLLIGMQDGRMLAIDVRRGERVGEWKVESSALRVLARSPGGTILALGSQEGRVHLWDLVKQELRATWETHAPINALAFVGGDDLLVTGGPALWIWDTSTGERIWEVGVEHGPVRSLSLDQRSGELAFVDQGDDACVLDLPDLNRHLSRLGLGLGAPGLTRPSTVATRGVPEGEPWRLWQRLADESVRREEVGTAVWGYSQALRRQPNSAALWIRRGRAQARWQDWTHAEEDSARAIELEPGGWEGWYFRGQARAARGRWAQAVEDLTEAIDRGAPDDRVWLERGRCLFHLDRPDRALADLIPARLADARDAEFFQYRWRALCHLGRWDEVIDDATRALERGLEQPAEAYTFRGLAYRLKKDRHRARADLDTALRLDPEYAPAYVERAALLAEQGQFDRALADLDTTLGLDPGQPVAFLRRAAVHLERREWARAIADFSDAIRLEPGEARAYRGRAYAFIRDRRYARAAADFARLVQELPEARKNAEFCRLFGNTLAELGQWRTAAVILGAASTAAPEDPAVRYEFALVLKSLGRRREYLEQCRQVLRRSGPTSDPPKAGEPAWISALNPEAGGDTRQCVERAELAAGSEPDSYRGLSTLGAALCRTGDFRGAERKLADAIRWHPGEGTAFDWLFLALAHEGLGNLDEARRWLDKAVGAVERNAPPAGAGAGLREFEWRSRLELQALLQEVETRLRQAGR
jgi:tetratricopeptide (TPR) repeat protein